MIALLVREAANDTENYADAYPKECNPANTLAPSSMLLVDDGKGPKKHVKLIQE